MPSAYTNDPNVYATHGDLADEVGSARALANLCSPEADPADPTLLVRSQAVRDVFKSLSRRTPPIAESMITDPTQIKDAVVYGALMRLYRAAMTTPEDTNAKLFKHYSDKFNEEIGGFRLTVNDGARVDVGGVPVFRR